jgi:FtsP/CotA-like multicopper oxidase with cupredoxin domain
MLNRRLALKLPLLAVAAGLGPASWAQPASQDIRITSRILEVNGKAAKVLGLSTNGSFAGLRLQQGQDVDAIVRNDLDEASLIHWHGLTPPSPLDGVPMLSSPVLGPGESKAYRFANQRTGTHWMHSHVGLQEQRLLAAPLIVAEGGEALVDEQEHVVMLHDFTFRDPQEILAELQGGGGLHANHAATANADPHAGHTMHGGASGAAVAAMLNDVQFDAILANDRSIADPEIVVAEKGGRFRLRIINGAAASNMWIDLGGLEGQLVAVDGNSIRPLAARRFPLAVAQRADVRLALPPGLGAYPIYFEAEGSTMRAAIVLKAGAAPVQKLVAAGEVAPALDLSLEPLMQAIAQTPDEPVARTEFVMLTGGEQNYVWGLNGKPMMHDTLFSVREGERYEIIMHNMTTMAHPMHLHGHYFRVVGIDGARFQGALRDTVLVPPGAQVAIQFDADNPGNWAFHCHHLYHMNSGMMGAITYSGAA